MKANTFRKIETAGIIPVVAIENIGNAIPLAQALSEGGLSVIEVTFRTECAKEAIKLISDEFPEMLVGAGTVITTSQVDEAIEAGASFIVSPGFDEEVVQYCLEREILVFPGVITPSEVMKAIKLGLEVVKFFPSETYGGLKAIKALSGPFPNMRFIPTGGINEKNVREYLSFEKVIACGGTWMCSKALINNQQFDEIKKITKQSVENLEKGRKI